MAVQEVTLSKAREKIKNRLSQVGSTKYSDGFIDDFVNEAQTLIATHTDCLETTEDITLVSSQAEYSIPDDWFRTTLVKFEGSENRYLDPASMRDYMNISVITTSSIPEAFIIDDVSNKIIIWPTPTTTDNVRHDYIVQPNELTSGTDILLNGIKRLYRYHNDVVSLTVNMIKAVEKGALPDEALAPFVAKLRALKADISVNVEGNIRQHRIFSDNKVQRVRLPSNYPCS